MTGLRRTFGIWLKDRLLIYKIENLDGNLTSDLYIMSFPPELRKTLGEFYTDKRIVEYILDWVGYFPQHTSNWQQFCFSSTPY